MIATAGLVISLLLILIARSPHIGVYDEPAYLVGGKMLANGSTLSDVLLAHNYNLAGPLFALLHWFASPLTHFDPWRDRWVNVVLFGLGLGALVYVLRHWRYDQPWSRVAMLLAFPPFWVCTGMALTEIPAFTCTCLCIAALCWAMTASEHDRPRVWIGFVAGGAVFGLAILGRQPYLPAIVGLLCIAVFSSRFRLPALVGAAAAILVPLPVFLIWGGLVAPDARQFAGMSLDHGILGYIYLSAAILLIAPRFYATSWRWAVPAAVILALVALMIGGLSITVAASLTRHLPPTYANAFQLAASAGLAGAGGATIVAALFNMWANRTNLPFVLVTLLTLGLTGTSIAIHHQFSSRYLMTSFPFALLMLQPYFTPSLWAAFRLLVGSCIGAFALYTYYTYGMSAT